MDMQSGLLPHRRVFGDGDLSRQPVQRKLRLCNTLRSAKNKHKGIIMQTEDCIERVLLNQRYIQNLYQQLLHVYLPRTRDQKLTADESTLHQTSLL